MKKWLVVMLVLLAFTACQRQEQDEGASAGDDLSGGTDVRSRTNMIDGIPVEDMRGGTDVQGGEPKSYKEIPGGTPAVCEKGGTPPVYQKGGTPAVYAPGGTPIVPVDGGTLVDCPGGTPLIPQQPSGSAADKKCEGGTLVVPDSAGGKAVSRQEAEAVGGTVVYPPGMKPPERKDFPAQAEGAGKAAPGSRAAIDKEKKEDDPQFLACTILGSNYITDSKAMMRCMLKADYPVYISTVDRMYADGYRLIQVVEPKEGQPIYYFDKKR